MAANVTVSGRHMELGDALTQHVQTQMTSLSEKYFGRMVVCRVVFAKRSKGHASTCNIRVLVGRKLHYSSNAESDTVHRCFAMACERMAKQLRRKKRALHEDKPSGQTKELVFNELLKPEPPIRDDPALPLYGDVSSIADDIGDETTIAAMLTVRFS